MTPFRNIEDAFSWLFSQTNYEKHPSADYSRRNYHLERFERLMTRLGSPQTKYPVIHIAGTKGKGSTAGFIAGALRAMGHRVGLYTSPHLIKINERISVADEEITDQELTPVLNKVRRASDEFIREEGLPHPTFFDLFTAAAFLHFRQKEIDWAVVEVGMGGRLDSTNCVRAALIVITAISLDHTHQLGNTIKEIAREKAGVIKEGGLVISQPQLPEALEVIRSEADRRGACLRIMGEDFSCREVSPDGEVPRRFVMDGDPLFRDREFRIGLLGSKQIINAASALAGLAMLGQAKGLPFDEDGMILCSKGIERVTMPGRVQYLDEPFPMVLDVAHNRSSMRELRMSVEEHFPGRQRVVLMGSASDKDWEGMLEELMELDPEGVVFTGIPSPRALKPEKLVELFSRIGYRGKVKVEKDITRAWQQVSEMAAEGGLVVVTGSFYLAGEVVSRFLANYYLRKPVVPT